MTGILAGIILFLVLLGFGAFLEVRAKLSSLEERIEKLEGEQDNYL
ncbi:hypothetical protein GLW08_04175 [Pontibacillus yanchengensis]|uniref:Uncharacterized protein n=2 Tax=Pontibacillus yanchengensis TaxID=462910 RepID=A0ACC7VCN6_9BACI|nr:hypothetical protein [Pontibacillus yanchengensis]MYL35100.1 hypothetical protein [Pontibacillus yanchengensis]MYL52533.1 hypothetical protein [Pontibacillus yanchengensis]